MSANNFVLINKKDLTISDCDADTGFGSKIGQGKTLDEAINLAQKYQEQNPVEYGINFRGRPLTKRQQKSNIKTIKSPALAR